MACTGGYADRLMWTEGWEGLRERKSRVEIQHRDPPRDPECNQGRKWSTLIRFFVILVLSRGDKNQDLPTPTYQAEGTIPLDNPWWGESGHWGRDGATTAGTSSCIVGRQAGPGVGRLKCKPHRV